MNDIEAEYETGLEMLGFPGMVFFKFLSTFSVRLSDPTCKVFFGAMSADVSHGRAETFRAYLKQQREWIRSGRRETKEIRQRMWWIVQKVIDLEMFNEYGHRYIMFWHDSCDDQLV